MTPGSKNCPFMSEEVGAMAVGDFAATVTLARGSIDTITVFEVKPDGKVTERTRVLPLGFGPERELTDEEKRNLVDALQQQLNADGEAFDAPAIVAAIQEIGGQLG